jgi:glutathione S-transferase
MSMKIYGSTISYYTGKLEAYLRYKGLGYELLPLTPHAKASKANTGAVQMPVVERDDGRWMSDTTPIIQQLENEHPNSTVLPSDPIVRFIALLMEDYADEWLWRPAMHYRWSYGNSRELAASILADEQLGHMPVPRWLKCLLLRRRQRGGFVIGDGVRRETRAHIEAGYFAVLDNMTRMLSDRSFLLGDSPSIADFGFMGPMFRHFGQDPTPAVLMRERAPEVFAWVARVWNAKATTQPPNFVDAIPADAALMLQEICETHLQQLAANAEAYNCDRRRFSMTVQGCEYVNLPVSRYRVACLETLRGAFATLDKEQQGAVQVLLPYPQAAILWDPELSVRSGYDEERLAPFNRAINVYGTGVPGS